MSFISKLLKQCRKPSGWFGRMVARGMNTNHSRLTEWGLGHIKLNQDLVALDIGCGGGGTVNKLAKALVHGKVYGLDYSKDSVDISQKVNAELITADRVVIEHGSVSAIPYKDNMFDLVTAIETHYFWPDLSVDLKEIMRVLKPSGTIIIIGGEYKGGKFDNRNEKWVAYGNMTYLTIDEHRNLLLKIGCDSVEVFEHYDNGWICVVGKKPFS